MIIDNKQKYCLVLDLLLNIVRFFNIIQYLYMLTNGLLLFTANSQPYRNRYANPFSRFVFRYVVDNGCTKLSRAGQKIFGLLNLSLAGELIKGE